MDFKIMNLLQSIQDTVLLGREISFKAEMLNLRISVTEKTGKQRLSIDQMLPLQDHFTELKLVECIKFMNNKLNENKKCDMCGRLFTGIHFDVFDENYNKQPGLICCPNCKI